MAKLKTTVNNASVTEFINKVADPMQRAGAKTLLGVFKKATKEKPKMWGSAIIGFGSFHYKSEHSAQEGDWMLTGFSPRKQNLTVYMMGGMAGNPLLKKLGKHKISGSCLHIKRMADVDETVLEKLIKQGIVATKKKYRVK